MNAKMLAKVARTFVCTVLSLLLVFGNLPYSGENTARADIETGLIGHWTFDDQGNPGEDTSGRGYHAALTDANPGNDDGNAVPVWQADPAGGGMLVLDGVDDYLDLGDIAEYEFGPNDAFSVSMWVKPTGNKRVFLIGRTNDDYNYKQNWTWGCALAKEGKPLYFYTGDGTSYSYADIGWKKQLDLWYHIVVTAGAQDEKMNMYMNGEKSGGNFTRTIGQTVQSSFSFKIGGELNTPYEMHYLDGAIDDVRIYNRALSDAEVAELLSSVNRPPTAYAGEATIVKNAPTAINLQAMDPNNDTLTYIINPPAHGTLTGQAPQLMYTPNTDFTGDDSFSFKVSDGQLESGTVSIAITVNIPAFPGAEGFGAASTGGRFGKIYHVTTLEDYNSYLFEEPIPGSLRWAIEKEIDPRIIVFDVGGTIELVTGLPASARAPNRDLVNVTIAGQTAPGGITLTGASLGISAASRHLIMRNIRLRGMHNTPGKPDGIGIGKAKYVIFDHVSVTGGCDEDVGSYADNSTFQWFTAEEAALWGQGGANHGEGNHNYGFMHVYNEGAKGTLHHTLIANVAKRYPVSHSIGNGGLDMRNNVLTGASGGLGIKGISYYNVVNNVYVVKGDTNSRNDMVRGNSYFYPYKLLGNIRYYSAGYPPHLTIDEYYNSVYKYLDEPWPAPPVATETAEDALQSVLAKAGAWPRDATTRRTTQEVRDVLTPIMGLRGPYERFPKRRGPCAEENDTDRDGMPDTWEITQGLNPDDPEDRNNIVPVSVSQRHAGYTYIEYFINELMDNLVGQHGQVYTVATAVSPQDTGAVIAEHGIYDQELWTVAGKEVASGGYNAAYWYGLIPFGTAEYNEGSIAVMKAKPKPSYEFSHWQGGPVDGLTATQVSFPVTSDVTVTAVFKLETPCNMNMTISPSGAGSVAGHGNYGKGDIVTLAVYSSDGYKFKRWVGGPADRAINPIIQFTAQADLELTAEFEPGSGGDFLIDDFNDQDADSFLIADDGQPKRWSVGSYCTDFYEIAPGNFALTTTDLSESRGVFTLGYGEDRKPEREAKIPEGTTVLKFRVYNIGDTTASINVFGRSKFQHTIHFSVGTPTWYWYNNILMYGEPLRFPKVEPGESAWIEIPLTHVRNRDMTKVVSDGDKLRSFNFGARAFGKQVWGTRVAYDDVAFGRAVAGSISAPNLPPVANAGRDQTTKDIDGGGKEIVLLNGLKSYDGNAGLITNWKWEYSCQGHTHPDPLIGEGQTKSAPPVEMEVGTHNITLTVTDEDGATSSDTVTITVLEQGEVPPPPPSLEGDVNGDGRVDIRDLLIVARAFGSVPGDASWDERADLHENGVINIRDLLIVARNFGRNL